MGFRALLPALLLLCAFALGTLPASAAIYRWTDTEGSVHYTDYQPDSSEVRKGTKVELFSRDGEGGNRGAASPAKQEALPAPPAASASGTPGALLFTIPNDKQCRQVRQWMTEQGVPFTEFDVKNQKGAYEKMVALGNSYDEVPFVVLNGWRIIGFAPGEYEKALGSRPEE